jgi:hypothetical protein
MTYLSEMWTLTEAVTWIATRNPALLASVRADREAIAMVDPATRPYQTLEWLLSAILAGHLRATARNVVTGERLEIPVAERKDLEFHIAGDLPGNLVGFRSRSDQIFRWSDPVVAAADMLSLFPRQMTDVIPEAAEGPWR